jgi:hypothetical protein
LSGHVATPSAGGAPHAAYDGLLDHRLLGDDEHLRHAPLL